MTKIIIPQANSVSPVLIKASHWQKYLGDLIANYILSGLGLSAGAGLNVSVAAGRGYIGGIDFESNATDTVAVVANSTNYIFAQLTFDGASEPNGWQYVVNQTGTNPGNAILLGTATTNASAVTGTSTSGTQQGLALDNFAVGAISAIAGSTGVSFPNDIAIGLNKLKTSSYQAYQGVAQYYYNSNDNAAVVVEYQTESSNILALRGSPTTQTVQLSLFSTNDMTTNYEALVLTKSGTLPAVLDVVAGGTGTVRNLQVKSGGAQVLDIAYNGGVPTVNAVSRLWSNFKLGNAMDANNQQINNIGGQMASFGTTTWRSGGTANYLEFQGGGNNTGGGAILSIRGNSAGGFVGEVDVYVPNAALNGIIQMASFVGNTDSPYLRLKTGNGGAQRLVPGRGTDGRTLHITSDAANTGAFLAVIPNGTSVDWSSIIMLGMTDFLTDTVNWERMMWQADKANNLYYFDSQKGGNCTTRDYKFKAGGLDVIQISYNSGVPLIDLKSRALSNLVLGNNLDAGSNRLTKAASLHFDPTSADTDSNIMGSRSSNLSFASTADGTTARQIVFRTPTVVTAGAGTPVSRLVLNAGVALGSSGIDLRETLYFTQNATGFAYAAQASITADGNAGNLIHNAPTGKVISARINGVEVMSVAGALITANQPVDFESYVDCKVISAPADPATGYVRLYPKTTDAWNDGLYVKVKKASTVTEMDLTDLLGLIKSSYPSVFWVNHYPVRAGSYAKSITGGGSITDIYNYADVFGNTTTGNVDIYAGGVALSWANPIIWWANMQVDNSQQLQVWAGIGSVDVGTQTSKHFGLYSFDNANVSQNWQVVSADGTTRSSSASTAAVTQASLQAYKLVYTPNSNIKFYVNGSLNVTKTTNLPNSGNLATTDIYESFTVRPQTSVNRHLYLGAHQIIGTNAQTV